MYFEGPKQVGRIKKSFVDAVNDFCWRWKMSTSGVKCCRSAPPLVKRSAKEIREAEQLPAGRDHNQLIIVASNNISLKRYSTRR